MTDFATAKRVLFGALLLMLPALAQAQIHNTGTIQFEVFANGNLGTQPPNWVGTGFVFDGDPGLFTGSFVVGASPTQVSGNYYGGGTGTFEWVQVSPVTEITAPFDQPYEEFTQGFEAVYNDSGAPNPIGLQVTQRSYSSSDDPYTGFAVVEFIIENTSGEDLTELYPGVFADWDVGPGTAYEQNRGGFDEATNLLYIYDDTGAWSSYFGVAALGDVDVSGVFYEALGSAETDIDIYTFLTTIAPEPPLGDDRRATLGVGPIDIMAGESATVRFAFVGGEGEAGIIANAAAAQSTVAGPIEQAIHNTGLVEFEVFDFGKLGSYFDGVAGTIGAGFSFDGTNGLFEASVLVAASQTQVSGDAYEFPNSEWVNTAPLTTAAPPSGFTQAFSTAYDDSGATNPIGVEVIQTSYSATGDGYVIVDLTVGNTNASDLNEIYIGIFADWDVSASATADLAGYDADTKLVYVYDNTGANANYYGVAALDRFGEVMVSGYDFDVIDGDIALYAGMTNMAVPPSSPADRRTVIGVGPYDIPAGETVQVQFAFVGGSSLQDILANAAAAQGGTIDTEVATPAGTYVLRSAYPNPFAGTTTVGFSIPETQQVRLTVYDLLGRRVATLVDGIAQAGDQYVRFDAAGLPSGTYLVRLEAGATQLTERVTVVR